MVLSNGGMRFVGTVRDFGEFVMDNLFLNRLVYFTLERPFWF